MSQACSEIDEPKMTKTMIQVDAIGTRCPIPLLRAKMALKKTAVGQCIQVLATDPSAKRDFDAMLKHLPHQLIDYRQSDSEQGLVFEFVIQKGSE